VTVHRALSLIEDLLNTMFADGHFPILQDDDATGEPIPSNQSKPIATEICQGHEEIYQIFKEIHNGKNQTMDTPWVKNASLKDRGNLLREVRNALLAQIHKLRIVSSPNPSYNSGLSLYRWVQRVGADDTTSGIVVKLLVCLINSQSEA
jgi:hypothetical protein